MNLPAISGNWVNNPNNFPGNLPRGPSVGVAMSSNARSSVPPPPAVSSVQQAAATRSTGQLPPPPPPPRDMTIGELGFRPSWG